MGVISSFRTIRLIKGGSPLCCAAQPINDRWRRFKLAVIPATRERRFAVVSHISLVHTWASKGSVCGSERTRSRMP
jgi:hypothetical protein